MLAAFAVRSLRESANPLVMNSEKTGVAINSDAVPIAPPGTSGASAKKPSMERSTATPQAAEISDEALTQLTPAQLQKLPLEILRKAYYDKTEAVEKNVLDTRFKLPKSHAERREQREHAWKQLQPALSQSDGWLAKLTVPGPQGPVTLISFLEFYDVEDYNKNNAALVKDPKKITWVLATLTGDGPSDNWASSGAMIDNFSRRGEHYYIVQSLRFPLLEATIPYIAVPVQLPGNDDAPFEYYDVRLKRWQQLDSVHWEPISRQKGQEILKQYQKFHEDED